MQDWSCVLETLTEMMDQRGYLLRDKTPDGIPTVFIKDDDIINVFLFDNKKLDINILRGLCDDICSSNMKHVLILYNESITPTSNNIIQHLSMEIDVEVFNFTDLCKNITKHVLVPEHIRISDSQKRQIFEEYKLSEKNIPKLAYNDPVRRFYNYKKGDLIKIIRRDGSISYRIVDR